MTEKLEIYVDGACSPNPGRGAWCAILLYKGHKKVISGRMEGKTTNQRAELTAAIKAFEAIKPDWECEVLMYSDSLYLINGLSGEWNVKTNLDLFQQVEEISQRHQVTYQWIKGHNGNALNEEADQIAEGLAQRRMGE